MQLRLVYLFIYMQSRIHNRRFNSRAAQFERRFSSRDAFASHAATFHIGKRKGKVSVA